MSTDTNTLPPYPYYYYYYYYDDNHVDDRGTGR